MRTGNAPIFGVLEYEMPRDRVEYKPRDSKGAIGNPDIREANENNEGLPFNFLEGADDAPLPEKYQENGAHYLVSMLDRSSYRELSDLYEPPVPNIN